MRRHRATGVVFDTNRHRRDVVEVGLGFLRVVLSDGSHRVTDSDGWYDVPSNLHVRGSLEGEYCTVFKWHVHEDGRRQLYHRGSPYFQWNKSSRDNYRLRSAMAYHHATCARHKFSSLLKREGFSTSHSNVLAHIKIIVDDASEYWSRWSGWDSTNGLIRFGRDVPYVLDAVAIYHEYAHCVIDFLTNDGFPCAYSRNDSDADRAATAVCEGFADYLACSLKEYPVVLQGEKDHERALASSASGVISTDDVYSISLGLSRGLWRLREELGAELVDGLVVHSLVEISRFSQGCSDSTLLSSIETMISVDERYADGKHLASIAAAFARAGDRSATAPIEDPPRPDRA
ncbi:hypothetical protein [Paludibaculum fermentans]|uniref:hypothetical protein n=1 Tax=Paludibaculum fermentans TaxID=1473598 RepID=UPI003EBD1677